MKSSISMKRNSTATCQQRPCRMYTENGLFHEAKNFLNGKNLYDSNLLENKLFAFYSIQNCKDDEVSRDREQVINDIDYAVDGPSEYITNFQPTYAPNQSRSNKFRSTGFSNYASNGNIPSRSQTAGNGFGKKVKYRIKTMRSSSNFDEPMMITFGSTKNIKTKMSKIDQNINKLHVKRKSNWSKKDLNSKFLLNGGNFKESYKRSTHTLFDHLKTQQINDMKSK